MPDANTFETAIALNYIVLTENVADFAQICADHITAGRHHPGVMIALSTQFSRRPSGIDTLIAAIRALSTEILSDRLTYLPHIVQD